MMGLSGEGKEEEREEKKKSKGREKKTCGLPLRTHSDTKVVL